jgi:hypothetical protein
MAPAHETTTSQPKIHYQQTMQGARVPDAAPAHRQKPVPPTRYPQQIRPPYKPGHVPLAQELAGEWIFPRDERYPKRRYQFDIAQTAVLHNTLVGLPTGLGKTLIAAVVMFNYYRWFPTGKVVFMAPTLPLVHQQVEACHKIMGIPEGDTAVLTGKISPTNRQRIWADRRAFFCTPETMQKDLANGRVDPKLIVLVVLDEARKIFVDERIAQNHAYNLRSPLFLLLYRSSSG